MGHRSNAKMDLQLPEMKTTWQETLGWQPNDQQQQQFQQLYALIVQGNQQLNLTRITEPRDFWEKHLWDSVRGIARFLSQESRALRVIDIGTGGGFPGLPVAIAQPHWSITLLDSTRKKVEFLAQVLAALSLANGQTLNDRAEKLNQQVGQKSTYDLALIRAVGPATDCAQYALPFLKPGGWAVLYRGQWTSAEADQLQKVLGRKQGQLESVDAFTTPLSQGVRHCLYVRKTQSSHFPTG